MNLLQQGWYIDCFLFEKDRCRSYVDFVSKNGHFNYNLIDEIMKMDHTRGDLVQVINHYGLQIEKDILWGRLAF